MLFINYGKDIVNITYNLLKTSDISSYLNADMAVSIKPNLVVARPADGGATTHTEVVEGIVLFLKDYGVKKISIIESSWVGDNTKRAYKICGYDDISKKYNIELFDLKSDSYREFRYKDSSIKICEKAVNTDFLINVPVLKAHGQTLLTCCMKNLKGCIPDSEKRRFHSMGLHKPIAALNALLKTGYNVVDSICGDLSFEEGGTPVESNRIIAGRDPVLVDSYCAELIGYQPDEIGYLKYAKAYGLGEFYSSDTKIVELNENNKPTVEQKSNRIAQRYNSIISENSACSACFSSLIFALYRYGGRIPPDVKLHIGQGYKNKSGSGIGIGKCACGYSSSVPGCPPSASDIISLLKSVF